MELAARARINAAQTLLEIGKAKEAAALVNDFASDPLWMKSTHVRTACSPWRAQMRSTTGPPPSPRSRQSRPSISSRRAWKRNTSSARILQETGERPEAVIAYEGVFKGYLEQRRKAEDALKNKDAWHAKPLEQMRIEALTRTAPEYVLMSWYNAATIQFDYGQFADAVTKYQSFLQPRPLKSELAPLAQLREGICQIQLKQQDGARRSSRSWTTRNWATRRLGGWASFSESSPIPPTPEQHKRMVQAAIVTFGRAGENRPSSPRPMPPPRRDTATSSSTSPTPTPVLRCSRKPRRFTKAWPRTPPTRTRAEAAHERWAMCLCREGQSTASDAACNSFLQKYPQSMLQPSVMFWQAENSYRQGLELAKRPDASAPAVQEQIKKLQEQAANQYQAVVDKYPEFAQISSARYGLGMAYYRQEEWEKADKQLERILDADRIGDLVAASYYQADCLIHTMPENADDALSAARLSGQLEEAAKLLSGFVGSNIETPETPDAMLKLADCYQRNAAILADQQEKAKTLQSTAKRTTSSSRSTPSILLLPRP